jgi:hypothetical protein
MEENKMQNVLANCHYLLDVHAKAVFVNNLNEILEEEVKHPEYGCTNLRIVAVLLTAALRGCEAGAISGMTGYSEHFINWVLQRAKSLNERGIVLDPRNWLYGDELSVAIDGDAGLIEGGYTLEFRFRQGSVERIYKSKPPAR